jgi:hypothetical protein
VRATSSYAEVPVTDPIGQPEQDADEDQQEE